MFEMHYNIIMISFAWDEKKDIENQRKHNISFDEAKTVFFDEEALEFSDPDHSGEEDRFIMLGRSYRLRVPVVCHCHRENEGLIRIISARKATKKENRAYARGAK